MDNKQYICTNLRNRKKTEITTSFVFHSLFRCQNKFLTFTGNVGIFCLCWKKSFKITRVIRISNSKKGRQHNGQKKKTTHDNPQNTTQKTNDRATQTPLQTRVNSGATEGQAVPTPLVTPVVLI